MLQKISTTDRKKTSSNEPNRKLRVAAYCRISKDSEEQRTSLEQQVRHYTALIDLAPHWVSAGVYADIGSGRNLKSREAFKTLMEKCRRGKVDFIVTKAISRFARNTLDALKALRMLKAKGIDVLFENEGVRLSDPQAEFMLTCYFAFAQGESESKSEDVKWGLRRSFKNPDSKKSHTLCYGYTHDTDGYLTIDWRNAGTVRLIFMLCYLGYSWAKYLMSCSEEVSLHPVAEADGAEKPSERCSETKSIWGMCCFKRPM